MANPLYLRSNNSTQPPLRVGVLMDGAVLLRSEAQVLADIRASSFATLDFIVFHEKAASGATAASRSKLQAYWDLLRDKTARQYIAYQQYIKIDKRLSQLADDPTKPVDCSSVIAGVNSIAVKPITKGFVHRFPEDAIEILRGRNLDVLLRFGFNILKGPVLTVARYGLWSFHHGDNDFYRGGPALFWEIRESSVTSGVILQVLTEELDAGQVLAKGVYATQPGLSLVRNRYAPYWGSSDMVIQKLRELHEHGWDYVRSRMVPPQPYKGNRKIYKRPTNTEVLGWIVPAVASKAVDRVRRALGGGGPDHEWRIGLRENRSLPDEGSSPSVDDFEWLPSPKGGYLADPFLFERNGRTWLFAEEYRYSSNKGVLTVCEVVNGTGTSEWRTCLEEPWHLSYPHVFEHAGEVFMVPESNRAGELHLYRASDFPARWTREHVLFRGHAVDTTVLFHDESWWFFATTVEPRGRALTLLLFYADSLTGEWQWHPANPISRDVRNARGAGAILAHDGKLFRPSQDNSVRYGYSFTLNEIVKLNRREYEERPASSVLPEQVPGMIATHTYGRCGRLETIDGLLPKR
jgi:hypothetical protein